MKISVKDLFLVYIIITSSLKVIDQVKNKSFTADLKCWYLFFFLNFPKKGTKFEVSHHFFIHSYKNNQSTSHHKTY